MDYFQISKDIIALFFLSRFSIEDIKKSEVKDFEIFLFFGISIIFFIFNFFQNKSFDFLIYPLIFLFFSSLLFFLGQWGAGDSFILTSLGLLFSSSNSIILLLLIFIFGTIYSFFYALIFSIIKKKHFFLSIFPLIFLILSFILSSFHSLIFFLAFLYSSLPFLLRIQKEFIRKVKVSELKEGDVLKEFKLWIGITKEEIRKLKRKKKYVLIKEGIRFAPVFLISFILFELFCMKVVTLMPPFLMLFLHVLQNLF
jgi:Flp pilus assembly protein protease CpaA